MSGILRVRWTVTPKDTPQPLVTCNRCGCLRPFQSSGKFRLNAQGKKLDAWLIYQCTSCDSTWNCPIFERKTVREVDPATMEALQSNSQPLAKAMAFDRGWLRRHALSVTDLNGADVHKELVSGAAKPWLALEILLALPFQLPLRTDRLLAGELGLSRAQLRNLERNGKLRVVQPKNASIRRPAEDRMCICIDLQEVARGAIVGTATALDLESIASDIF